MPDFEVLLYSEQLALLGSPITNWTTLDVTLKFNEPSSGLFTVPGYSSIRDQVGPGSRVVVRWRPAPGMAKQTLISGPIEDTLYERGDDGEHAGAGTLTVNFADDLATIGSRITYPDPALVPESWAVDSWTFSGTAETGMRHLVNVNAGTGAMGARQIPYLLLGDLANVTTAVTIDTRLEPILDVLRRVATAAGGVGFRTYQGDGAIYFEVYQPRDLSNTVRYSFDLGNIRYLSYRQQAPTATAALVGGQGEGADRYVLERVDAEDEAAWGRSETYVARAGSATTLELQADGDEALLDTHSVAQLTATTIDVATQRFGQHYALGDTVAVSPAPGTQLAAQVKTVHVQAWATAGELVTPTIGDQGETTESGQIKKLRQIDKRVRYLERTVMPAAV